MAAPDILDTGSLGSMMLMVEVERWGREVSIVIVVANYLQLGFNQLVMLLARQPSASPGTASHVVELNR